MSIESIKARLKAASEGPWVMWTDCTENGYIVVGNEEGALTEERPFTEDADFFLLACIEEDATFAAHARTDLPALLRVAEAAKVLEAKLRVIHADEKYQAVWTIAKGHVGQYSGPKYDREQLALVVALAALEAHDAP